MRVFSLQQAVSIRAPGDRAPLPPCVPAIPPQGRPARPVPSSVRPPRLLLFLALLAGLPATATAQWPAELEGGVVDAVSGDPVEGAVVEVVGAGRVTTTDGTGGFRLRGLDPGPAVFEVRRLGYGTHRGEVELENGRRRHVRVELHPRPVPLDGVSARASRRFSGASGGGVRIGRAAIAASGAVTAGELLRGVPGVVVREQGPGGAETVSIRGSAPDAVLVLLDGAPLNDPVTGAADLSTVPAGSVEEILVLPGARTARFGARARAGVVAIETRAPGRGVAGEVRAGSLQRRGGALEAGGEMASLRWGAGAGIEEVDGGFGFRRPDIVGGGAGRRRNADVGRVSGWASAEGSAGKGEGALRLGLDRVERGLPGRSFAPSDSARQDVNRLRAAARWGRVAEAGRLELSAHWSLQRIRFRDPAPPLGLPYDQRTRVAFTGMRVHGERVLAPAGGEGLAGAELELRHVGVDADGLDGTAPEGWLDGGGSLRSSFRWPDAPGSLEIDAAVRLDRDGVADRWHVSHELTVGARLGRVSLHAAHRSAFSPPTLGDQFFREGVGVEPNPELRGERVPSEWEVGARATVEGSRVRVSGGASAFVADVRDMIVWAPDFRFVWSPDNVNVDRRGVDAWLELGVGLGSRQGLSLGGHYSLARVTYADPARRDVQLLYRPRHTGSARLAWASPAASVTLVGRYTGTRLPTPSPANELPPFWTMDLRAQRAWSVGRWTLRTRLSVDRILDRTDTLIFAYPDPGRTLEVGVRLERGRP